MSLNNGLDKLGEHMSVKKYLYREHQMVFDKVDAYKKTLTDKGVKCSTKDAMTHLILKGFEYEQEQITKVPLPVEPEVAPAPEPEPTEEPK